MDDNQHKEEARYSQKYKEKVHVVGDYLVEGTDVGNWNETWHVTMYHSKHMTPNRGLFLRFKTCFDVETQEHNNNFLFTNGIGEVALNTSGRYNVIPSVSYVPEIGINVFSMQQLIKQGFEIEVKGSSCTIKYMFDDEPILASEDEILKKQDNFLEDYFEKLEKDDVENITILANNMTKEEMRIGTQEGTAPMDVTSFEDFIAVMRNTNNNKIATKNKDLSRFQFEKMLIWFHKTYNNKDIVKEIPPMIVGIEICLFDVYKLGQCFGGYESIAKKDEWKDMAMGFGFPEIYDEKFKNLYEEYLLLPEKYYEFAKDKYAMGGLQKVSNVANNVCDPTERRGTPCKVVDQDANMGMLGVANKDTKELGSSTENEEPSIEEYENPSEEGSKIKGHDDYVIIG